MGYATLTDAVTYGLVGGAYGLDLTTVQVQAALDSASAWADTRMRARYSMPLLPPYDVALVEAVVHIARKNLLATRGFDLDTGSGKEVTETYAQAVKLLDDVRNQSAHLAVVESPAPTNASQPQYAAPLLVSQPLQGWIPDQPPGTAPGSSGIS